VIQTKGPAMIRTVGDTDPLAVGESVVPDAENGSGKGPTAAGITAAEVDVVFAISLQVNAAATAAKSLVYLLGNFNP